MKKYGLGIVLGLLAGCSLPSDNVKYEKIVINEPFVVPQTKYIDVNSEVTPQIYAIAATRGTNKMLDQTADIYENGGNTFLYIKETQKIDKNLPDGFYSANRTIRDIIEGSNTYKIVNNMNDADYYLETKVFNDGTAETPIVSYQFTLYDSNNAEVRSWNETIRQLNNGDRSWW